MNIALIPARSGSKRLLDKNIKILDGHPLIAYTIVTALKSQEFDDVIVCTDSQRYASISREYGASTPYIRDSSNAGSCSPDLLWVKEALEYFSKSNLDIHTYSILRPTNPCRSINSIKSCYQILHSNNSDSVRAVSKCLEHPGKMWVLSDDKSSMMPLLPFSIDGVPWHSNQYAALPLFYTQNASLEVARSSCITQLNSISGNRISPFITPDCEDIDINTKEDWNKLLCGIQEDKYILPAI